MILHAACCTQLLQSMVQCSLPHLDVGDPPMPGRARHRLRAASVPAVGPSASGVLPMPSRQLALTPESSGTRQSSSAGASLEAPVLDTGLGAKGGRPGSFPRGGAFSCTCAVAGCPPSTCAVAGLRAACAAVWDLAAFEDRCAGEVGLWVQAVPGRRGAGLALWARCCPSRARSGFRLIESHCARTVLLRCTKFTGIWCTRSCSLVALSCRSSHPGQRFVPTVVYSIARRNRGRHVTEQVEKCSQFPPEYWSAYSDLR